MRCTIYIVCLINKDTIYFFYYNIIKSRTMISNISVRPRSRKVVLSRIIAFMEIAVGEYAANLDIRITRLARRRRVASLPYDETVFLTNIFIKAPRR